MRMSVNSNVVTPLSIGIHRAWGDASITSTSTFDGKAEQRPAYRANARERNAQRSRGFLWKPLSAAAITNFCAVQHLSRWGQHGALVTRRSDRDFVSRLRIRVLPQMIDPEFGLSDLDHVHDATAEGGRLLHDDFPVYFRISVHNGTVNHVVFTRGAYFLPDLGPPRMAGPSLGCGRGSRAPQRQRYFPSACAVIPLSQTQWYCRFDDGSCWAGGEELGDPLGQHKAAAKVDPLVHSARRCHLIRVVFPVLPGHISIDFQIA
jgi:hypothetical protein